MVKLSIALRIPSGIRNVLQKSLIRLVILMVMTVGNVIPTDLVIAQDPSDKQLFLPIIIKPACLSNIQEQELATLLTQDPNQQHPALTCHPILAQVAHQRAEDMAQRGYFGHTSPEGYGPNYLVRQAGYVLPAYYSTALAGNNIESIAAGTNTAAATWQVWINSAPHREHLLGLKPFYNEQIEYGVGYAYNPTSPYDYYWVVIIAKPGL